MDILHKFDTIPDDLKGGVVVLGNFDGVHRGHQSVIGKAMDDAEKDGLPTIILTFEPHPRNFFKPDQDPFRLSPLATKTHHLEALGVKGVCVLEFGEALASMSAEDFIDKILIKGLDAKKVVVGYDFCFGQGRVGTPSMIEQRSDIEVMTIDPVTTRDQEIYSSTRIRDALKKGKPGHAAALMGRPFEIQGKVLHGDKIGRTIGFPTANVDMGSYLRPHFGVYAVRAGLLDEETGETIWHDGVANLGKRPTVNGIAERFEVFLFDFEGDIYDRILRVAFIEFIRGEKKFDGLDALKAQIDADCHAARRILDTRAAGAV